jgi:hypothetical protein
MFFACNPLKDGFSLTTQTQKNVAMQKHLLKIVAVAEALTGVALIFAPEVAIVVLFGIEPGAGALMISRVGGLALLCLGVACWSASADPESRSGTGVLNAIAVYNVGAGALLCAFAASGEARGVVIWIAGIAHLGLGAAFVAARLTRRSRHIL